MLAMRKYLFFSELLTVSSPPFQRADVYRLSFFVLPSLFALRWANKGDEAGTERQAQIRVTSRFIEKCSGEIVDTGNCLYYPSCFPPRYFALFLLV